MRTWTLFAGFSSYRKSFSINLSSFWSVGKVPKGEVVIQTFSPNSVELLKMQRI